MGNVLYITEVVLVLGMGILALKALFFWVYLWQLKEYRRARFRADYGARRVALFWLGGGGRRLSVPVWTGRALVLGASAFVVMGGIGYGLAAAFSPLMGAFVAYALVPVAVALLVWLSWLPNIVTKKVLLYRVARKRARLSKLIVIGITGSFGKSSTKEFLASVLSQKFRVVKTPANINSEIGIARFVLSPAFDEAAEVFVVEVGAYRQGEIRNVAQAVRPNIAIITAVSAQHLSLFGSIENTRAAKYELVESLQPDGLALFNGENAEARALSDRWQGTKIVYTTVPEASLAPVAELYRPNVSAAIVVARHLGMDENAIAAGVRALQPTDHMLTQYQHHSGTWVIQDLYSANPDGVMAALRTLAATDAHKKIVIMPCLIELGSEAARAHRMIGKALADLGLTAYITTSDHFADIQATAGDSARLVQGTAEISAVLKEALGPETAVLLEGRLPAPVASFFAA